jgi:hypothetical protein
MVELVLDRDCSYSRSLDDAVWVVGHGPAPPLAQPLAANRVHDSLPLGTQGLLATDFAVILLDLIYARLESIRDAEFDPRSSKIPVHPHHLPDCVWSGRHAEHGRLWLGTPDNIYKPFDPHTFRSKVTFFVDLARKTTEFAQASRRARAE